MASGGAAATSFDAVSLGIDDERGVVVGPVIGAQARPTVISPAGCKRRSVESIDALARRRGEAEVQPRLFVRGDRVLGGNDPECDGLAPVAERAFPFAQACVAERLQGGVVEAPCRGDVTHADGDMIEHGLLLHDEGQRTAQPLTRRARNSAWVCHEAPPSSDRSPSQRKETGVISLKLQRIAAPASALPSWTMSLPRARPIWRL